MSTTLDLAKLEELEAVATPGEWATNARLEIGPRSTADDQSYGMMLACAYADSGADAAFIPALRNAAPALIAAARERDELRAALGTAERALERYAAALPPHPAQHHDVLRSESPGGVK